VHGRDVALLGEWLESASNPVIVADHYNASGDPLAVQRLASFAERWSAPVIDIGGRLNMPTSHDLCMTEGRDELLARADLVLALDVRDLFAALRSTDGLGARGFRAPLVGPDVRVVAVGLERHPQGSWVPDYFAPHQATHEVAVPSSVLVRELLAQVPGPTRSDRVDRRKGELSTLRQELRARWSEEARSSWDSSPISTARLSAELGKALAGRRLTLTNSSFVPWPVRLWDMDGDRVTHIGRSGGEGLGYGPSASVGAALACKEQGKIAVDIQGDGDLLFTPSALWTAAAYELPLLMVVHNNRSYHQDARHQREVSRSRQRGEKALPAGIELSGPEVNFVDIARGMGVTAFGPIADPSLLAPVFAKAVRHIEETGRPVVVDVLSAAR
jgi:thiamine pyrophosphate-dependent acetolactate synthase large subunit-like protein